MDQKVYKLEEQRQYPKQLPSTGLLVQKGWSESTGFKWFGVVKKRVITFESGKEQQFDKPY